MTITSTQIMGWTQELLVNQSAQSSEFMDAVWQKGGAEGWAQVKLNSIYAKLPGDPTVQREQPIYNTAKSAVDFLITPKAGPRVDIELKIESLFQSAKLGRETLDHTQWELVAADVEKLRTDRKPAYAKDAAYAVAVVWSDYATKGLDNWLRNTGLHGLKDTVQVQHGKEAWPASVYVIIVSGE